MTAAKPAADQALLAQYRERPLGRPLRHPYCCVRVWSAVRRSEDGHHIRCIVAHAASELAAKLEAAEKAMEENSPS